MDMTATPQIQADHADNRRPNGARIAVLFQRFGPYHHTRLNAAGKLMQVFGFEACGMEDTYAWDKMEGAGAFTRITLTKRYANNRHWKRELARELRFALERIKPEVVVVPGWSSIEALAALLWCAETRTPTVVMSESTEWDESRRRWKEWIKGRLVGICSAGLAGGTAHANYLARLGLDRKKIFLGYDVVDNGFFAFQAEASRRQGMERSRQNALPEKFFLASARFVEKKNLPVLIRAYARYRELAQTSAVQGPSSVVGGPSSGGPSSVVRSPTLDPWSLVLLGDGPLRSSLLDLRSSLGLEACVHLPGFKQYGELPAYYALAEAFIHASTTEQWGLVVNEAMASGLPVLVSNRCGCAQDLVHEGVNGFTFDPNDASELAHLMQKVSAPAFPLAQFGSQSSNIVANWGPQRFAEGLEQAVASAMNAPKPCVGTLDRLLLRLLSKV